MTDFDAAQESHETISRKGGESTKAKYGTEHYRRLGQLSAAKRKANARQRMVDLTRPMEGGFDVETLKRMTEGLAKETNGTPE